MAIDIIVTNLDGVSATHPLAVSTTLISESLLESLIEDGLSALEYQAEFAATEMLGYLLAEFGLLDFPGEEFVDVLKKALTREWCESALVLAGVCIDEESSDFLFEVSRLVNEKYVQLINELGGQNEW